MSRVSRNILYNGLGQGAMLVLGFVAVRFVFRRLGGDALGLIYFSQTFSAALALALQLGICETAVREVASHHAVEPEYIKSFIRTSSLLYWTGYFALAIVAYTLCPYLISHWVKLDSLDPPTAIKTLRILSLGCLLALPGGLYRALLTGLERMGLSNVFDVSAKGFQQGGIFLILLMNGSLFHVVYWIVGCQTLQLLAYLVAGARFFSTRVMLLPNFSRAVVKRNIGYASAYMTITLCSWALTQADRVVVSKLLPLALLGMYSFARSATGQGALLTSAIAGAIYPRFSALYGAGKSGEMKRAYNKIHDLICLGTIPGFAAVPFAAIPVFSHVFNRHSAQMLLLPATFLCLGCYMNGTLVAPYIVSLAAGRPGITARNNLAALFVVVPASAIAIYFFGLNGAGFSWVIYHIFGYSYGLPRICRECLGIAPRIWYRHVFKIMGSAILIYGSAWITLASLGISSVISLATAYAVATAVYCVFALWSMGDELRQSIIGFLNPLRLKVRPEVAPQ